MAETIIRTMELKDIPDVHDIFKNSIKSFWSLDELTKELYNDIAFYLVSETDGSVSGFCGAWLVLEEAQITNIAIREDLRNTGIGKKLFKTFIKELLLKNIDVIYLEVRESNTSAQKFYESLDFEKMGIRKRFYSDGENAFLMYLPIN